MKLLHRVISCYYLNFFYQPFFLFLNLLSSYLEKICPRVALGAADAAVYNFRPRSLLGKVHRLLRIDHSILQLASFVRKLFLERVKIILTKMQHFQNLLRVFRYLSKKQSYQLFYRQRESSLLPYSFLLSKYNGRRFRHSSYNSPNDNFRVIPFMAFGIMVAHCAKEDDENNKLSTVYGMQMVCCADMCVEV